MTDDQERGPDAVAETIERLIHGENIQDLVAAYFEPASDFAGETFNTLGGNDPYRVTAADLLAVSLLDTPYPPGAVRSLLGADQGHVAKALHGIDCDIDLWDAGSGAAQDRAADLWQWLNGYSGVGPTRAGKLLARKRPRLVPIVDDVVVNALPAEPDTYWADIAAALQQRPGLVQSIEGLRPDRLTPEVTTLRLLDVAIWMTYRGT